MILSKLMFKFCKNWHTLPLSLSIKSFSSRRRGAGAQINICGESWKKEEGDNNKGWLKDFNYKPHHPVSLIWRTLTTSLLFLYPGLVKKWVQVNSKFTQFVLDQMKKPWKDIYFEKIKSFFRCWSISITKLFPEPYPPWNLSSNHMCADFFRIEHVYLTFCVTCKIKVPWLYIHIEYMYIPTYMHMQYVCTPTYLHDNDQRRWRLSNFFLQEMLCYNLIAVPIKFQYTARGGAATFWKFKGV